MIGLEPGFYGLINMLTQGVIYRNWCCGALNCAHGQGICLWWKHKVFGEMSPTEGVAFRVVIALGEMGILTFRTGNVEAW